MILIADASALIALAACEGLQLLDTIFGDVWVPISKGLIQTVLELAGELDSP